MNKLEQLHLEAIDKELSLNNQETPSGIGDAASKSAEITEQIAIGFHKFYEKTAKLSFDSTGEHQGKPIKEIFQEFLKTK